MGARPGEERTGAAGLPLSTNPPKAKAYRISMKAIQIKHTGGPEVMEYVDLPVPQPKSNEALVKITASGVNFIDVYYREGLFL